MVLGGLCGEREKKAEWRLEFRAAAAFCRRKSRSLLEKCEGTVL